MRSPISRSAHPPAGQPPLRERTRLVYSAEVAAALDLGQPVVALESNVVTHGLTFPQNLEAASEAERAVREEGAVPATVAIIDGRIVVGLSGGELERLAASPQLPKVSSRGIPMMLARGETGVLTVASSLVVAELAGIEFFASAGIGGVHRGAELSMDVSSDLVQFTRSKVAVVSAGAKRILDIGLTLEYLETHCVPVVTYRTDMFPAFYCESSGYASPQRMDSDRQIVASIDAYWALGQNSAFIVAAPPNTDEAIASELVEEAIGLALDAARRDGVRGQAVTKYVMRAVDSATEGQSAEANRAVLVSTARLGGRLATAFVAYKSG